MLFGCFLVFAGHCVAQCSLFVLAWPWLAQPSSIFLSIGPVLLSVVPHISFRDGFFFFDFSSLTRAQAPATKSGRLAGQALFPKRHHLGCLVADFFIVSPTQYLVLFFFQVPAQSGTEKFARLGGQALAVHKTKLTFGV